MISRTTVTKRERRILRTLDRIMIYRAQIIIPADKQHADNEMRTLAATMQRLARPVALARSPLRRIS